MPKIKNLSEDGYLSTSKDRKLFVSSKAMLANKDLPNSVTIDTSTTQSMLDLVYVPLNIPVHIAWNAVVINTRLYLGFSKQIVNEINGCYYALLGQKRQDIKISKVDHQNNQLFSVMPNLKELDGKVVWIMQRESEWFLLPDTEDELRLISFKSLWKIQNKIFIDSSIPEEISSSSHENYFSK